MLVDEGKSKMLYIGCNIRDIFSVDDFRDMIESYEEAYEPPIDEDVIDGMRYFEQLYDMVSDDFLYWVYLTAILEDIIEDEDGYHSDDYLFDGDCAAFLGQEYAHVCSKPDALAVARLNAVMVSQGDDMSLTDDAASILYRFKTGMSTWDDIERATELYDEMWKSYGNVHTL